MMPEYINYIQQKIDYHEKQLVAEPANAFYHLGQIKKLETELGNYLQSALF